MFGIWQAGKRSRGLVFPSKFSGASCSNFCFTWVLVVKLRAAHFEWLRSCLVCNMPIDLDFSFYIISPTFDVRRYCWSLNFCQLISIFPDAYLKLLFSTFFCFEIPIFFLWYIHVIEIWLRNHRTAIPNFGIKILEYVWKERNRCYNTK